MARSRRELTLPVNDTTPVGRKRGAIHPVFKQLLGELLLASAHPKGLIGVAQERKFTHIMNQVFTWLKEKQERSVLISNEGNDINLEFKEGGRECDGPII
jgi:hypothetical protein